MSSAVLQKNGNIHLPIKHLRMLGYKAGDELFFKVCKKTKELIIKPIEDYDIL